MANHSQDLTAVFKALADPTRRAVVQHLAATPASVTDLARPHAMALPSFLKHLGVLEECGLVITEKSGRVRTCRLNCTTLRSADAWLADQITLWEGRTERLADYVETTLLKDDT